MNLREYAIYFAGMSHKDQKYGESFYYHHLVKVDEVLESVGFHPETCERIAVWLHDVVEDCGVEIKTIQRYFGSEISNVVWAVTNELGENRKEKALKTYPKIRRNERALAVKLADRIANMEHSLFNHSPQALMYYEESPDFVYELFYVSANNPVKALWKRYHKVIQLIGPKI